jgi:hypothetical protein
MSGKKGQKWAKNKHKLSVATQEAIATAEQKLPELLEVLVNIALDKTIANRDKIDAIKVIADKILTKQSKESSGRGLSFTADDFALMELMSEKAVQTEEFQKTWTSESMQSNPTKPMIETSPDNYKVFDLEGKTVASGG